MIKIAIISDLHANIPALNSVLEDVVREGAEQIYCLGDLVDFAPWPNETIEIIKRNRMSCIMGNHDERIAFDLPLITLDKHSRDEQEARVKAIEFTRREISQANKEFLKALPRYINLRFLIDSKPYSVLLAHGSSRDIDEYIYEDHDETDLYNMLRSENADALIVGHTHLSFIRHLNEGKVVINCGSVGRTKEDDSMASYLMVSVTSSSIDYTIRKVPYDVQETAAAIKESSIPDFYADFLLRNL